jgi:hypothetical protein
MMPTGAEPDAALAGPVADQVALAAHERGALHLLPGEFVFVCLSVYEPPMAEPIRETTRWNVAISKRTDIAVRGRLSRDRRAHEP